MFDDRKLMLHSASSYISVELCPKVSNQPCRIRNQYDRTIGGRNKFSCMPGFIMIGVLELVCKGNGKWSDKEPTCYSKTNCLYICRATIVVYCYNYSCRGMRKCTCYPQRNGGEKFGDKANYTCNLGYRLATNQVANLVCQQNGHSPPHCVQS